MMRPGESASSRTALSLEQGTAMTRLSMIASAALTALGTPCVAQWSISPTTVSEGVGTANFTLTRPTATSGLSLVRAETRAGSATLGNDYRGLSTDFIFTSNSLTSQPRGFQIIDDTLDEDDEHLFWDVTLPDGSTQTFRITIEDNDPLPTLQLGAGSVSASEGRQATVTATLSAASSKVVTVGYRTNDGAGANAAVAGEDYEAASGTLTFAAGETTKTITVDITDDSLNELAETLSVELRSPNNAELGTRVTQTVTIAADASDPEPSVAFARDTANGREGKSLVIGVMLSEPSGRVVEVEYETSQASAKARQDYLISAGTLTFAPGETEKSIRVEILSDDEMDSGELFEIDLYRPDGATLGSPSRIQVTILEGDDPILEPISDYLSSRAETLLEIQPGLTRFLDDPGEDSTRSLSLRVGSGGVNVEGGFARGGVWFDATGTWSESEGTESRHVVGTLGAHREVSDGLLLGGMLQYDATDADLTAGSGSIEGKGWMAGPYFVANGASGQLRFEGRLLYGRSSNDIDFAGSGSGTRAGTFDGERWLAQARVVGERPLGNGVVMIPSAGLGHAREIGDGFRDSLGMDVDGQTVAMTRLQLGAELEIPVESAKGDLTLRPGLAIVLTDASGERDGEEEPNAGGRFDIGVDYRLDDRVSLGFEGFYSGFGRTESEIYGAGLNLRMEF